MSIESDRKQLKQLGFKAKSLDRRRKLTPQRKSAITRMVNTHLKNAAGDRLPFDSKDHKRFDLRKFSKSRLDTLKEVMPLSHSKSFAFVRDPQLAGFKNTRVTITPEGYPKFTSKQMADIWIPVDRTALAQDHLGTIRDALERAPNTVNGLPPQQVSPVIWGWRNTQSIDANALELFDTQSWRAFFQSELNITALSIIYHA